MRKSTIVAAPACLLAVLLFTAPGVAQELDYEVVLEDFNGNQLVVPLRLSTNDLSGNPFNGQYQAVASEFRLNDADYTLTSGTALVTAEAMVSRFILDLNYAASSGCTVRLMAFLSTQFGPEHVVFADDTLPAVFPAVERFNMVREFRLTSSCFDEISGLVADVRVVEASDTSPPEVACSTKVASIWPPNGKLVNVGLELEVTDDQDASPAVEVFVFSNEPDKNGKRSPDAANVAPATLQLRAERLGKGGGRIYLIVVLATDEAGNVGMHGCSVVVPHDKSAKSRRKVEQAAAAALEDLQLGTLPEEFRVIGSATW
jgi:hypothetical protein